MLKEKLQEEQKAALKAGDSQRRMTLGLVLAAIKNKEIEKRGELGEEDVIAVIASEIKKRKDSAAEYEKAGRPQLAEGERKEIEILSVYLPEQMPEEEIRAVVKETIKEMGLPAMPGQAGQAGKVIGAVMAKLKEVAAGRRIDGQMVSAIVKSELGA